VRFATRGYVVIPRWGSPGGTRGGGIKFICTKLNSFVPKKISRLTSKRSHNKAQGQRSWLAAEAQPWGKRIDDQQSLRFPICFKASSLTHHSGTIEKPSENDVRPLRSSI
jgi:hypothetical protein